MKNIFIIAFKYNQEKNGKKDIIEEKKISDEKEQKTESDIKPKNDKIEQPMMIGTPIFIQNIPKFWNNKIFKKKNKVFTEREGDWVCQSCKNLNFAFRVECNRCHLPKPSNDKKEHIDNIKDNHDNQEQKPYKKTHKYKKNYNHHNKNKCKETSKE